MNSIKTLGISQPCSVPIVWTLGWTKTVSCRKNFQRCHHHKAADCLHVPKPGCMVWWKAVLGWLVLGWLVLGWGCSVGLYVDVKLIWLRCVTTTKLFCIFFLTGVYGSMYLWLDRLIIDLNWFIERTSDGGNHKPTGCFTTTRAILNNQPREQNCTWLHQWVKPFGNCSSGIVNLKTGCDWIFGSHVSSQWRFHMWKASNVVQELKNNMWMV